MDKKFLHNLNQLLPADSIMTDKAECLAYGYDNSKKHSLPDVVVFPETEQQVTDIVRCCYQHKVIITARGRGTGTTGATVPIHGGLVMSFERMNRILNVDPDNRAMTVEPGVTNEEIQLAAKQHGFFWAPDPTSAAFCTVGGNLAYNSAGPRAVKYGTCRENTLGLHAVTGKGELIKCGVCTTKGVVGYDLTRLLIGSEGTLGIITQATLKLLPVAKTKRTLKATYNSIESAARAVSQIMAQAVTPCALEFMDTNSLNIIRDYTEMDIPSSVNALLMIEVDGNEQDIDHAAKELQQACVLDGHIETTIAQTDQEVKNLWMTRKALSPSLRKIAPKKINEDIVVPVSNMAALINKLNNLSREFDIPIVNFGHAGNGNIHVNLLINPNDKEQMASAEICLDKIFDLVLSLNGTLSGEHGVGLEKRDFIYKELGKTEIELMHSIKKLFDPENILNPNKTLPIKT
jgi:glycolate oxidase subunit GlcD